MMTEDELRRELRTIRALQKIVERERRQLENGKLP